MPNHQSQQRQRILAQVRRLPAPRLAELEAWLRHLECGDSSPFSPALKCGDLPPLSSVLECGDSSPLSHSKDWPHAPVHRLSEHGTYIVTAATLHKEHCFRSPQRLDLLESTLLRLLKAADWQLEAWAVFSNHYHFVAHSQAGSTNLRDALKSLHGQSARQLNQLDDLAGRAVWHNFWDTQLTYEKSYLARLNYVHHNPVKHGLVPVADQYPWCSAAWFQRTATRAQVRTIYSFKIDKLRIHDDYDPL